MLVDAHQKVLDYKGLFQSSPLCKSIPTPVPN